MVHCTKYLDEHTRLQIHQLYELRERREKIEALLSVQFTPELWRELNIIDYKIECAEAHFNGTYARLQREKEYHVKHLIQ